MTTVSAIEGNVTATASRNRAGLLDRLLDWMNHVVDVFFAPSPGTAHHGHPAEAYLFLIPSCCGEVIDSDLWDLLTERPHQSEIEEGSDE
jgi:hypothetical protein